MKRSATAAQLAYPQNWRAAQKRRVASRLNGIPIPYMQRKAIQAVALQTTKRYISRNSDKKMTQDYSGLLTVSSTGGVGDLLANLVQGDNSLNNFSGSKITPTYLQFNYVMDFTANIGETAAPYTSMRFMIVQDRGAPWANGAGNYVNLTLSTLFDTLALVQAESNDNWTCLYDSGPIYVCTTPGFANLNGVIKAGKITIPKRDLRNVFFGDEGSGTNVERNNLRCVWWSDSGVAPHPQFAYQCEVGFTDEI